MTYFNPLGTSLTQASATQQQLAADKNRQVRRAAAEEHTVDEKTDRLEHEVDGSEAIAPLHEDAPQRQPRKNKPKKKDTGDEEEEADHIDLKA